MQDTYVPPFSAGGAGEAYCVSLQSSVAAEGDGAERHRLTVVSCLKNGPQSIPEIWSQGLNWYEAAVIPTSEHHRRLSCCPLNIIEMLTVWLI